uniref:Multiple C2 domain-containing protein n=1 Tax=Arundo donax TaxID=35708 RepID=A0A0A9BJV6_ARUDO
MALVAGLYVLRHPRFRSPMPSAAGNFFKRLPSRADTML